MFADIDVLLVDLQDAAPGLHVHLHRVYCMETARNCGKRCSSSTGQPAAVRPSRHLLIPEWASFVAGPHPMRHGLTIADSPAFNTASASAPISRLFR